MSFLFPQKVFFTLWSTDMSDPVSKAKQHLLEGHLVAIPTETVYGLAGNALQPETVARIFEAKKRPFFDPLIVHIHSVSEAKKLVTEFPEWAEKLAAQFWPGPLTLLLPKNETVPEIVTSGSEWVGIRIPNHPLTLALLQSLPFPLAAPSANPFGYVSPTTAQHVADQLEDHIAYILDGGPCEVGVESTIVGFEEGQPTVFRTGGIAVEELEKVLGQKLFIKHSSSKPLAPGMLDSHYAPLKPLLVGNIAELIESHKEKRLGIISFSDKYESKATHSICLSPAHNLNEAACGIFGALREMDNQPIDLILSEHFPDEGLGKAINDRLARASAKR